jgi:hypothetical protein
MNDMITTRDEILSHLVSLRNRYREICRLQAERLEAVEIEHVPGEADVDVERVVMIEEGAIIEEFASIAEGFPVYGGEPTITVSTSQAKQSWFTLRRPVEILVEEEDPSVAEARLQDSRILHISGSFAEDLSERRASLQHASYTIKRAVVGLNQSAAYSISEDATRKIDRERHRLETLVSIIERTISDIVIAARRISMVAEPAEVVGNPLPDQLKLAG